MAGSVLLGVATLVLAAVALGPDGLPLPAADDGAVPAFTVVWNHVSGAVDVTQGALAPPTGQAAGCLAASSGEQWAIEPPGVGACAHAWQEWPFDTTVVVCAAVGGCFVDAINANDIFDYIVLECQGAPGLGAAGWGDSQVLAPTCATRASGDPPTTWAKWDSQILSFGGATSAVHGTG